jgi:choline dehydrogenase-like flavoprotein
MPVKLHFGSDYPYRGTEVLYSKDEERCDLQSSLAIGGFSTVWGAAALPYDRKEISHWPVPHAELEDGYRALRDIIGISGDPNDEFSEAFPHYVVPWGLLPQHPQTQRILQHFRATQDSLASAGLKFATARVMSWSDAGEGSCIGCGLCLYGCPRRLIYNSAGSIERLAALPGFEYRTRSVVLAVEEGESSVEVRSLMPDGTVTTVKARRVFSAAGVLPSSLLALRASGVDEGEFSVQDSQYFIVPALAWNAGPRTAEETPYYALSQFFLQIRDEGVCSHIVHLQGYPHNPFFEQAIWGRLPRSFSLLSPLIRQVLPHLVMLQGFLHSSASDTVKVAFRRADSRFALKLSVERNPNKGKVIERVQRKLLGNSVRTRLVPLTPSTEIAEPGRSFHFGGSFPMRAAPTERLQSDTLGRPSGLKRIHLVDASVLPDIPATTITLTVMANAWRIGNRAAYEDYV